MQRCTVALLLEVEPVRLAARGPRPDVFAVPALESEPVDPRL